MALTYPLSLPNFLERLRRAETTFEIDAAVSTDETGGGEIYSANYGPQLWYGTVTTTVATHAQQREAMTRVRLAMTANASFLVTPLEIIGPADDPIGTILGASTPTITAVAANNRDITISGLPGSYNLREGDYLSFTYGSPIRYAFHQIQNNRNATVGGVVTLLEVNPPIRVGIALPAAVTLIKPQLKAVMVRSQYQGGAVRQIVQGGFTFGWRQTLA